MELFDFHCHIDLMPSMINFARDVAKTNINVLTVTTTPKAFEKEIEILKQFSNIKVGLGLHPQLVSSRYRELSLVKELSRVLIILVKLVWTSTVNSIFQKRNR